MKITSLVSVLFFCFIPTTYAQVLILDSLTSLDPILQESSGLEFVNGKWLTHTDSGGENAIYEINPQTGTIEREVRVNNANNIDWEDICADQNYLYIGDIGNNRGTRRDLRIYRISLQDFENSSTLLADTISISYAAQNDFSPRQFQTNYDAESLISVGDSLYIFSKNWGNQRSYLYSLPKLPGTYSLEIRDSLESQGLITGGDYDAQNDRLSLSGYTFSNAFYLEIQHPDFQSISSADLNRVNLVFASSFQLESLCHGDSSLIYLSTEGSGSSPAILYELRVENADAVLSFHSPKLKVFPNPSRGKLKIDANWDLIVRLFSQSGKLVFESKEKELDLSQLPKGMYWLQIEVPEEKWIDVRKLILH